MTASDPGLPVAPPPSAASPRLAQGRALAGAIAVFLGGYLVLLSFNGQAVQLAMALTSDGRAPAIPLELGALAVLQLLFALVVTAVGILLPRGSLGLRLGGVALAVVGPVIVLLVLGAYYSGTLRVGPAGDPTAGVLVRSVFLNPWFLVVLLLGVAWLLSRRARLGWLALLGTLLLIPVPSLFAFGGAGGGISSIVMFALSGLVGAGVVLAGRPWRD